METDLFGIPDSPDTTKNAATEAAKATRKTAPKDQASPLAERLRPKTIDEVVGQKHLLGPGKPLRSAFENAHPHSMILWGPPGVGKTTLARLMADAFGLPFISISTVLGGVKDIRDAVEKATANRERTGRSTVVLWMKSIGFLRASRTLSCPMWKADSSLSSVQPQKTRVLK